MSILCLGTPVNILKNQFSYLPSKQEGVGFKVNHKHFFPPVEHKLYYCFEAKKTKKTVTEDLKSDPLYFVLFFGLTTIA